MCVVCGDMQLAINEGHLRDPHQRLWSLSEWEMKQLARSPAQVSAYEALGTYSYELLP